MSRSKTIRLFFVIATLVVIGLAILPGANAYTAEPTKIARADADQSRAPQAGNQIFVPMVGVSQLLPSPTPTRTRTPSPTALPTTTPLPTATPYSGGTGAEWAMLAANPQRTSWTPEEVRGGLGIQWYRPIEPYISYKIQPVAANGKIYVSTARGLYAFNASNGNIDWVYPTELPLGHSPTIAKINNVSTAFVGGYDHKIHALNAMTGQKISGYTSYEAGAGFETNPLVINDTYVANTIFAGNRDGYFYALDAVTGALKWRVQTNDAILFSAAYKNGVVYFASNDMYAYALNAANGALVWKSQKFLGQGFHSYWPVIYTHKASGKDYVIFSTGENYRFQDLFPVGNYSPGLIGVEIEAFLADLPVGQIVGATGNVPGARQSDNVWVDASLWRATRLPIQKKRYRAFA